MPFPPPGDGPNSGIKPGSPVSEALAGRLYNCVTWASLNGHAFYQDEKSREKKLLEKISSFLLVVITL